MGVLPVLIMIIFEKQLFPADQVRLPSRIFREPQKFAELNRVGGRSDPDFKADGLSAFVPITAGTRQWELLCTGSTDGMGKVTSYPKSQEREYFIFKNSFMDIKS